MISGTFKGERINEPDAENECREAAHLLLPARVRDGCERNDRGLILRLDGALEDSMREVARCRSEI